MVAEFVSAAESAPGQGVAILQRPVQARIQAVAVDVAVFRDVGAAQQVDLPIRPGIVLEAAEIALEAFVVDVGRQRIAGLAGAAGQVQRRARPGEIVRVQIAQLEFALVLPGTARALAQHDIHRAGDRLGRKLGAGRAHDFDALDQVGRQVVQREAGRRLFAVDQELGIAAAQAAHLQLDAAPIVHHRHAGNAFQDIEGAGVAIAFDVGAADHDLHGGVVAPRIVAGDAAFHLDLGGRLVVLLGEGRGYGQEQAPADDVCTHISSPRHLCCHLLMPNMPHKSIIKFILITFFCYNIAI
jgi:hypothetical protein